MITSEQLLNKTLERQFSKFYSERFNEMYQLSQCYLNDTEASKDIVADAFSRLWKKRSKFDSEQDMLRYLRVVVRHCCIDVIRYERMRVRRRQQVMTYLYENTSEREFGEDKNFTNILLKEVDQLPDRCKEVMKLYLQQHSSQDIAQKLNMAAQTVRNQHTKAVQKLRRRPFVIQIWEEQLS